ncbi:OmpA family protein [Bacteroides sp. UBA939]|uniref:OmpA family protein n=1 Tax=Bacteroides sp. UBA939 TaxID=1946092 RepID=UPI0025C5B825|nr:OmpA family protein [Bacteroides sp. UBA939]
MIKKIVLMLPLALALKAQAGELRLLDSLVVHNASMEMPEPIEPSYLENITSAVVWKGNWFLGFSNGALVFAGSPLGHANLFDRIEPTLSVSAGKWFTPAVGGRVSFQGFKLKNSLPHKQSYQSVHADFLWNVLSRHYNTCDLSQWNLIPYVGLGIIHNEGNRNSPFAFSYGVTGQYRLSQRIHLTMELGGTTTFKDFDGRGVSNRFGDNLISVTAGLSFSIGKVGWKRVIDANPYIWQNKRLMEYVSSVSSSNSQLIQQHNADMKAIVELKKILEIEGLLELYQNRFNKREVKSHLTKPYPKNNYSGLNSLRSRLQGVQWSDHSLNGDSIQVRNSTKEDRSESSSEALSQSYLAELSKGKSCIGAPVFFFFFKIGTNRLTDTSQLVNLDEIARIAKKYNLSIRICGAADSATGTPDGNHDLGASRSGYIRSQLLHRGIDKNQILEVNEGGIDTYASNEANRHTKVMLFLK